MQSTSADYKTAIASTDREIRGYLKFNNTFTLRGSDGLVSFKTTQNAMDAERYCAGSTTSCFCEASFYNSGLDGSGVSLANSYFDAYIGVVTGDPPDAETDDITELIMNQVLMNIDTDPYWLPATGVKPRLEALTDGDFVKFTINETNEYIGAWDATTHSVSVNDGTLTYRLYYDSYPYAWVSIHDENDNFVSGTYRIGLDAIKPQVKYVCCGRYYISEITRGTATTRIVGYDIAGRLSINYVPTVTPDPDDGYLVMDILNDIIDQTGVNGGTHFTTYGDSTYVAQIFEGNCRAQWGWLCSLVSAKAASYSGTREPADLGYMKEYYAGNGEANPYAVDENTTYLDGVSFGDEYTITSFTTGTTDTPIVIGNGTGVYGLNPYMDNATATTIEGTVDNYQYYPATLHWRGDPALDIFDEINVTQGVDTYKLIAMKIETTFNGGLEQTINCYGDSENYYALSTSPTQGQINRVSNLVQEIQQAIETADGGVITKILDVDGTWSELVIANNQDLDQATSVWRFNINGLAHSNRYKGGTYTLAMDTQGRIIANVIQTGILQDANGNNSWNLDTGLLTITDGSVNIHTSSETNDIIELSANVEQRTAIPVSGTVSARMQPTQFEIFRNARYYSSPQEHPEGRKHLTTALMTAKGDAPEFSLTVEAYGYDETVSTRKVAMVTENSVSLMDKRIIDDGYIAPYTHSALVSPTNVSIFADEGGTYTDTVELSTTGLEFSTGGSVVTYPASGLGANNLKGSGYNLYSSTGTTTINLATDHTYLVTCMQRNSTSTTNDAAWLVSSHTNNSNIIALKSSSTTTASVSGLTLTITRGAAYSRVTWTRLG